MDNLKLSEVNDQAIRKWKQESSQPVRTRIPKQPKESRPRGDTRPPQIKDIRPMGKSLTEIIFSKKHGRYMQKTMIKASANWGYAQDTIEWSEISDEKRIAIEKIDRMQNNIKASKEKKQAQSVSLSELGL